MKMKNSPSKLNGGATDKSLWRGIDQNIYNTAVKELASDKKYSPERKTYQVDNTELRIAEAIACYASYQPGVLCVSAATADIDDQLETTTIVLTMNNGIPAHVENEIQSILNYMQSCARGGESSLILTKKHLMNA
jgi:hypothetical protein